MSKMLWKLAACCLLLSIIGDHVDGGRSTSKSRITNPITRKSGSKSPNPRQQEQPVVELSESQEELLYNAEPSEINAGRQESSESSKINAGRQKSSESASIHHGSKNVTRSVKTNSSCSAGYVQCNQSTQCIPRGYWCDGDPDCPNGSDEPPDCCRRSRRYPLQPLRQIASYAEDDRIVAVAVVKDLLLALRAKRLTVYNQTPYELLDSIQFNSSSEMHSLALGSNSVYVSDTANKAVYKIHLSNMTYTVLTTTGCETPCGLSVNRQNNLLVTCSNGPIQEYSPSGALIRTLPTNCSMPSHAVEQDRQTIVVACSNDIYQMSSRDGRFIRRFGSSPPPFGDNKMALLRLGEFPSLAVDRRGYVLVAQDRHNRIRFFDPLLTKVHPLQLEGSITSPSYLWLDESRGQLYVCEEYGQKRLLIYEIFNLCEAFRP